MKREYAEWVNFWWEDAPDTESDRALLIGDSITGSYRARVQSILKAEGLPLLVDSTIGSRGPEDEAWFAELDYMLAPFNGYAEKYRAVHLNNGLHAGYLTAQKYESGMRRYIEKLLNAVPAAKIILATSTPTVRRGSDGTLDCDKNRVVFERNDIVRSLADEYGFQLDDLFWVVAARSKYPQPDGCHFGEEGQIALAESVAAKLETVVYGAKNSRAAAVSI